MNTVKTKWKVLAFLALAVVCLAMLAGCNNEKDAAVSEIFVLKNDSPRLTYVQGQELELGGGVLTVVIDGATTPVPLDSAEVSVTGYDKNLLGPQTLTVTYQGKTTTIEVTVIARSVAENFESNYFVGDSFDSSKGRLKITKDDGTAFYADLGSEQVSLKSFDSSKAGKTTVTVEYRNGETVYDCSFDVTVHEIHNVTLTPPQKTKYISHETELYLSGAYLTVEAPSPSDFSKYVSLTPSMISGFDPGKVTIEHKDTPVVQTLTVTYAGKSLEFDVEISYSPVYLIGELAKTLEHLDWTQATAPEISKTEGETAMEAITAYLELVPSERELVDEETLSKVLNPATIYLNQLYFEESESFSDAFIISANGYLTIIGKSYDSIADAIERLENSNDIFNTYAALLGQIREELGDRTIQEYKISELIMAHDTESIESVIELFEHMLVLSDTLKAVPDNWTVETLASYADPISIAVSKILISDYVGINYNQMYDIVSSWRANDDYFDIIYSYYYYVKEGGQDEIGSKLLGKVPLPGILNDWHTYFQYALSDEQFMLQYEDSQAYLYDTARFMYYYFQTMEYAEQINDGTHELYAAIYDLLGCEIAFENNLRRGPRGYIFQMGEALDSAAVLNAWEQYLALVHVYLTDPEMTFEKYGAEFREMFDTMASLTPSELYAFTSSVNFLYDSSRGSVLVMDCSTKAYSTLMYLVANYYATTLSEDLSPYFFDLLIAMENYSLVGVKEAALDDFKATMKKVTDGYQGLNAQDKAIFDEYLGTCYTKYLAIYNSVSDPDSIDLGAWEPRFDELKKTLEDFDLILIYITSSEISDEAKNKTLPLLFALYEKANLLYNELLSADAAVQTALCAKFYTTDEYSYTLDQYFYGSRTILISLMVSTGITLESGESYMTWDLYSSADFQSFFALAADLMLAEHNGVLYEGDVAEIMAAFRALTAKDQNIFYMLNANLLYYAALERYFTNELGDTAASTELIQSVLRAEIAYAVYMNDPTEETLEGFQSEIEKMTELYGQLSDTAKFDECLGDVYSFYTQKHEALTSN